MDTMTKAEKLYHLLFEVCNKKENKIEFGDGAYLTILSVTLIMNDNRYKDIQDIVNPNEIKTFFIVNQSTGKKIILLAKDIKSSSYRNGELRINRYSIVLDRSAKTDYIVNKRKQFLGENKEQEGDFILNGIYE